MSGTSKLKILVLILGLGTTFSSLAVAQAAGAPAASPAAPATKIGVVNIQDAIAGCNEGKKEFDALQAKFDPKRNELKTLNDEVDNLKKQFEAQGSKLSPEASASQAKTIADKQKILQRNYDDAQTEFQQAEQDVVNKIGSKMLTVLEKYAKANGYAVILDVSNPQTPVLYAHEGTNLTKDLVDAYNAANPVALPPAKTSGAAAPAATPRPAATHAATPAPAAATPKNP
jgi:outer membrane protein